MEKSVPRTLTRWLFAYFTVRGFSGPLDGHRPGLICHPPIKRLRARLSQRQNLQAHLVVTIFTLLHAAEPNSFDGHQRAGGGGSERGARHARNEPQRQQAGAMHPLV